MFELFAYKRAGEELEIEGKGPVAIIAGHRGLREALPLQKHTQIQSRGSQARSNVGGATEEISLEELWLGPAEANAWLFALAFSGSFSC